MRAAATLWGGRGRATSRRGVATHGRSRLVVLVQRTTAPEQPRRLVAAELTAERLSEWSGAVVVENHVNVLRSTVADNALSSSLLAALLNSAVFDRLFRCLTGTVAVSA